MATFADESAYPIFNEEGIYEDHLMGFTKREKMALHLYAGILAVEEHSRQTINLPAYAEMAVQAADALIVALNRQQ